MKGRRRARKVILLGPQALQATVGRVVEELGIVGEIATVTAGWQERESEQEELDAVLGRGSANLRLYERAERVGEEDPELVAAHRRAQDRLKLLRRAYNLRLARGIEAWRGLARLRGDPEVLEPEREAALQAIRALDRHHVERVREIREEFRSSLRPLERPAVARPRREIEGILGSVEAVVLAGGHVAVLLNRLNAFGLAELLAGKTLIAWSAGAMALSPRVVLFHDSPPQGPGNAEVLEDGLDLFPGLVPLPDGSRRLRIDDRERCGQLARRFAPSRCALLDAGTRIEWSGRGWRSSDEAWQLASDGSLETLPRRHAGRRVR